MSPDAQAIVFVLVWTLICLMGMAAYSNATGSAE